MRSFKCLKCHSITSVDEEHPRLKWDRPRIICGSCGEIISVSKNTEVKQGVAQPTGGAVSNGISPVTPPITSALGSSNGSGQPIKITKEYLEHESIQLYMDDKSTASFRNLLEVFKICYNSKNEKEIDLDLEDFELVGKQVRAMRDIRPEAKEPL